MSRRVQSGLFPLAKAGRNRYRVVEHTGDSLRFRSTRVWTGINVGLNDVLLSIHAAGTVSYKVSYWVWAKYCLTLSAGIGGSLAVVLLPALLGIGPFPDSWYPPSRQLVLFGLPMILFWGLVWPWILIALHKRPAAACLERILEEVNGDEA